MWRLWLQIPAARVRPGGAPSGGARLSLAHLLRLRCFHPRLNARRSVKSFRFLGRASTCESNRLTPASNRGGEGFIFFQSTWNSFIGISSSSTIPDRLLDKRDARSGWYLEDTTIGISVAPVENREISLARATFKPICVH